MRLFVALDLPDAVREPLAAWRADVPDARWVPAERLHLTLRFLGETSEGMTNAITGHLERIRRRPVPIATGDLIRLPSARRPRALAVRVNETAPLGALVSRLGEALGRAGAPAADHELLPHVTLARVRQPDPAAIRKALRGLDPPEAEGVATSFSLVESRQTPDGPEYVTLLRVPLAETPTASGG
ncbi:RNA 2',3'-cyclic phosphodiesterase [Rubrivirga marina]|uniref:RNA 2',3'-cyclic phosphodiesterase n=1 Tax=Rubrivirga marina TaxID=1196024 RepID=A0A271J0K0_9BACT|nr:RNA 2',3'-cyclic phosphodiesterase [Rubrivirga marina]PAP77026.1 2'-5' RNA ligase [Rubrivirga marina]